MPRGNMTGSIAPSASNYGGARYPAKQTDEELRDIADRVQQIHAAFAELTLGGGITLHQAHLEGFYDEDEEEWLAARGKDMESHWAEVPDWKLESGFSPLHFLDAEGWRFYIPAFMCWSLKNWRTTHSITVDTVLWALARTDDHLMNRYELLNRAQSEAVCDFLAFFDRYSGQADASKAVQAYWHQFKKA